MRFQKFSSLAHPLARAEDLLPSTCALCIRLLAILIYAWGRPLSRFDGRYAPRGRECRRPAWDGRSVHTIAGLGIATCQDGRVLLVSLRDVNHESLLLSVTSWQTNGNAG